VYRNIGDEEGIGDPREGEIRIGKEGEITARLDPGTPDWDSLLQLTDEMRRRSEAGFTESLRVFLAEHFDDPEVRIAQVSEGGGRWKVSQNLKVDDSEDDSPFLFCLSREPTNKNEWERLRAALPQRYDTWTVTRAGDVNSLEFEIECGLKRWMGLNHPSAHQLFRHKGWVVYAYETIPPSAVFDDELVELALFTRWFQKSTKYREQAEFRLAWQWVGQQSSRLDEVVDIKLTKAGLELFKPWEPPG